MLEPGRFPTFIAAVVVVLAAAWIMWLGPKDRVHRALALFLLLRGSIHILVSVDSAALSVVGRATTWLVIALPFAAMNFAYVFARGHLHFARGSAGRRLVRPAILVALLVFEAFYLFNHAWWIRRTADGFETGWLTLFIPGMTVTLALLAFIVQRAAAKASMSTDREALQMFAIALVIEPAYRLTFDFLDMFRYVDGALDITNIGLRGIGLLAVAGVVWQRRHRVARMPFVEPLPLVAILAGLVLAFLSRQAPAEGSLVTLAILWTIDAFWLLAFVALTVYATLMYHLFDIDLKAKALVNGGTITAGLGFVLVVIGEGLERVVEIADSVLAILLAVAITLMLRPAQRLALRIAEAAFPGVERTDDYVHRRRVQVYRAALEGAYRDGDITEKEREVLATLREEVGLDEKAAEHLERRVREQTAERLARPIEAPAPAPDDGGLPKPP